MPRSFSCRYKSLPPIQSAFAKTKFVAESITVKPSRRSASVINYLAVTLLSFPCLLGFNVLKNVHPLGGDSNILDFEDWLVSDLMLPLGSLMLVVFCCWGIGWNWKGFFAEANTGSGVKLPNWLRWYASIVLPLLIAALFALCVYGRFFA